MSVAVMRPFAFEDMLVRVVDQAGVPWFVAQDVCSCLEISNHRMSVSSLDDDERASVEVADAMGRMRPTTLINESGVYVLIFRSRKPVAKRFRKWVTGEVLPSLRQYGEYRVPANDLEPELADEKDVALSLGLVREARQVWGRAAAQRLWQRLELPDVGLTAAITERGARALTRIGNDILGWKDACTIEAENSFVPARILYESYLRWCHMNGFTAASQTAFGLAMSAMGHKGKRGEAGQIERQGLILTE